MNLILFTRRIVSTKWYLMTSFFRPLSIARNVPLVSRESRMCRFNAVNGCFFIGVGPTIAPGWGRVKFANLMKMDGGDFAYFPLFTRPVRVPSFLLFNLQFATSDSKQFGGSSEWVIDFGYFVFRSFQIVPARAVSSATANLIIWGLIFIQFIIICFGISWRIKSYPNVWFIRLVTNIHFYCKSCFVWIVIKNLLIFWLYWKNIDFKKYNW